MQIREAVGRPGGASAIDLLRRIDPGPVDAILQSMERFAADPRPGKVNLGVGIYYDADGRIPVMRSVLRAGANLASRQAPSGYLPAEGLPSFRQSTAELLFGLGCSALKDGRIAAAQTLGGTGALKLAAELLAEMLPDKRVAVSDPTWPNHAPVLESAGLQPFFYPYIREGKLDFAAMAEAIRALPPQTPVLLHACCHNPSGVDLGEAQWRQLATIMVERDLIPFIDIAYQGFGQGLDADAFAARLLADSGLPVFVAFSCSKNFSLYGERVGAVFVVAGRPADAQRLTARMKTLARSFYSTPPRHGAALVAEILAEPELRRSWQDEVEQMRLRIIAMRHALAVRLAANPLLPDYSFITRQHGLFSFARLSAAQVRRLTEEFAIYAVEDGRLCMAALNPGNVDRVAEAIGRVLKDNARAAAE